MIRLLYVLFVSFQVINRIMQCFQFIKLVTAPLMNNKQLLDEVEHDIVNYQNRGLCYLPKPKAEADNTDTRF